MTNNTKLTNKIALNTILNTAFDFSITVNDVSFTDMEIREKLRSMLDNLNKPVEKKVDEKKQNELTANRTMVLNLLADGEERTIGNIIAAVSAFKEAGYTPQKITAIMKSLCADSMVMRVKHNNKMWYRIV